MHRGFAIVAVVAALGTASAQTPARDQLARGHALWEQRLSKSAIAAFDAAARDTAAAAEAHEALGRIYTFKGWQQENAFPGWHDEPGFRDRAIAELKAAVAADPARASAQEALRAAEAFMAADKVDPALPRPDVRGLDAKLQSFQTTRDAPITDIVAGYRSALDALVAGTNATDSAVRALVGGRFTRGHFARAV